MADEHGPRKKKKKPHPILDWLLYVAVRLLVIVLSLFDIETNLRLARFLGETAGSAAATGLIPASFDALIPIPLHATRQRERGYNQSEWIASGFSHSLSIPVLGGMLRRIRSTRTQTDLGGEERQVNVRSAFRAVLPDMFRGRSFLLVDDVITTGATVNACAKALKNGGALRVAAITLARPPLTVFHRISHDFS